jgi:hypothetical protein
MADLKFDVITENGQPSYLGILQNGKLVPVYRCVLHQDKITAKALPSGKELQNAGRWRDLILDFTPLLYMGQSVLFQGDQVDVDKEIKGFSLGNRQDIGNSGEVDKHLRFRGWQIYLFQPTIAGKKPLHPGLWEKIKMDQPFPDGALPDLRPPGYGP